MVAKGLDLALVDMQDPKNQELYFDANTPCFKKLTSKEHLYSQLVTFLLNRTLNIVKQLIMHDIQIEPSVSDNFQKLATHGDRLTDVFMLSRSRINDLKRGMAL